MTYLRMMGKKYIRITGLLATFSACHLATKYFLKHAISLLINRSTAALLCYILIPFITITIILNPQFAKLYEKQLFRHSKTVLFTILEGILSGYILCDRHHQTSPPCIWLVPLGIAIATYTGYLRIGSCHEKLIFVSVGLGTITELVFGLIVGITTSYLCITAIYAMIGYISIQFYVRKYRKEKRMEEFYEASYVLANVYTQLFISYTFAYSAKIPSPTQA